VSFERWVTIIYLQYLIWGGVLDGCWSMRILSGHDENNNYFYVRLIIIWSRLAWGLWSIFDGSYFRDCFKRNP
jgi:hypothetical protein